MIIPLKTDLNKMKKTKNNYTYAPGKRKRASARVRIYKGKEESQVNGKPLTQYFPDLSLANTENILTLSDLSGKYFFHAKVDGGGKKGQLTAVLLGVARAISKLEPDVRTKLKKLGLLSRDSRIRERRKVGTGGKARRVKQSPKR